MLVAVSRILIVVTSTLLTVYSGTRGLHIHAYSPVIDMEQGFSLRESEGRELVFVQYQYSEIV